MHQLVKDAAHANADRDTALPRLNVNVTGSRFDGVDDHAVHKFGDIDVLAGTRLEELDGLAAHEFGSSSAQGQARSAGYGTSFESRITTSFQRDTWLRDPHSHPIDGVT